MTDFVPRFGLGHGIFNSLFLAVSAFCNAGFDNLSSNSLQDYATNPTINLAVAFLIMSGSLGFAVWIDLIQLLRRYIKDRPRNWKLACRPLSNQSRLVLISTGCLLLGGTLLAWLLEMDNSKTIGTLNVWQQLLVSFFSDCNHAYRWFCNYFLYQCRFLHKSSFYDSNDYWGVVLEELRVVSR